MEEKMKNYVKITFMVLLAVGVLFLGACSDQAAEENTVDSGLVGNWSNGLSGNDEKTFSINPDGSFTAKLSPYENQQGEVEGVLIKDGSDYKMNNMREKTGATWGAAVGIYNGTYVQITLSANNTAFELKCKANNIVEQFFGGTYHKQQ
jgi:hypothetical protein